MSVWVISHVWMSHVDMQGNDTNFGGLKSMIRLNRGEACHTYECLLSTDSQLHLESHPIWNSNFNRLGLFSRKHVKRDLENEIKDWDRRLENTPSAKSCTRWRRKCLMLGWLRLVGSLKLQVSSAEEPCERDYILQKRPMILRSLLIVATPSVKSMVHINRGK